MHGRLRGSDSRFQGCHALNDYTMYRLYDSGFTGLRVKELLGLKPKVVFHKHVLP